VRARGGTNTSQGMPVSAADVYLFPGQGSQVEGMAAWVERFAPDLYDRARLLLGGDPFEAVERSTRYAQPAILLASLARFRAAGRPQAKVALIGHSLGELTALAAAGAISEEEALELAVHRGEAMAGASEQGDEQGLLAVIGPRPEGFEELVGAHDLFPANENSPNQLVVGGLAANLERFAAEAQRLGLRAVRLRVRGAYHTPLLGDAVGPFEAALAAVSFASPPTPVISGATGEPFSDPRAELALALVRPVRFVTALQRAWSLGGREFADVGPGRVLVRLARETLPEATAKALAIPELSEVGGGR